MVKKAIAFGVFLFFFGNVIEFVATASSASGVKLWPDELKKNFKFRVQSAQSLAAENSKKNNLTSFHSFKKISPRPDDNCGQPVFAPEINTPFGSWSLFDADLEGGFMVMVYHNENPSIFYQNIVYVWAPYFPEGVYPVYATDHELSSVKVSALGHVAFVEQGTQSSDLVVCPFGPTYGNGLGYDCVSRVGAPPVVESAFYSSGQAQYFSGLGWVADKVFYGYVDRGAATSHLKSWSWVGNQGPQVEFTYPWATETLNVNSALTSGEVSFFGIRNGATYATYWYQTSAAQAVTYYSESAPVPSLLSAKIYALGADQIAFVATPEATQWGSDLKMITSRDGFSSQALIGPANDGYKIENVSMRADGLLGISEFNAQGDGRVSLYQDIGGGLFVPYGTLNALPLTRLFLLKVSELGVLTQGDFGQGPQYALFQCN